MDVSKVSVVGLLKLYGAVREALEADDQLELSGLQPIYGVRQFPDWREWANKIECELNKRGIKYVIIKW